MKGKKIKRILAGLSSSLCMMACSPRKSEGFFGLDLNSIMMFERLTKTVANLTQAFGALSYMKKSSKSVMQNLKGGDPCRFWRDLNPTYFKWIDGDKSYFEEKCSDVVGIDSQIKQLQTVATTYINKLLIGGSDPNNVGIMISGPSGCGKSYLTSIFTHCFVEDGFDSQGNINGDCKSILRLSSASVDPESSVPVLQQLFGDAKSTGKSDVVAINPNRSYIEKNPNGGIIIFEEGEKAYNRNFAEAFRNMLDQGEIVINGIKYPMRNYIIIFTTNASNNSLKCIDKPLTQAEKDLGYVKCDFDRSFLNRFEHIIVAPLGKFALYSIFDNLISVWNDKNEKFGVSVHVPDDVAYEIASFLESTKQGGRRARKLFDSLLTPLWMATSQKVTFERSQKIDSLKMVFEIGFDEERQSCFISGMHEDLSKISEKDADDNLEHKNAKNDLDQDVDNNLGDEKSDAEKKLESNDSDVNDKESSDVNDKGSDVEKGSDVGDSGVNDDNLDESDSDLDKKGFNLDDNREMGEVNA